MLGILMCVGVLSAGKYCLYLQAAAQFFFAHKQQNCQLLFLFLYVFFCLLSIYFFYFYIFVVAVVYLADISFDSQLSSFVLPR